MAGRDAIAKLAAQHVLNTLRLDRATTARILASMTQAELVELADAAEGLREQARTAARARDKTWGCVWGCEFDGDPAEHHKQMHGPLPTKPLIGPGSVDGGK